MVGFRWSCDKQLRDAVTDFAADTGLVNPWAADLYDRARERGHDHAHSVRILARAWLHVIWHCWQDGLAYDPSQHHALQRVLAQQNQTACHRASHSPTTTTEWQDGDLHTSVRPAVTSRAGTRWVVTRVKG